ncbi:hypothetical protein KCU61_g207, partial [Aureobasidium melanogenum]
MAALLDARKPFWFALLEDVVVFDVCVIRGHDEVSPSEAEDIKHSLSNCIKGSVTAEIRTLACRFVVATQCVQMIAKSCEDGADECLAHSCTTSDEAGQIGSSRQRAVRSRAPARTAYDASVSRRARRWVSSGVMLISLEESESASLSSSESSASSFPSDRPESPSTRPSSTSSSRSSNSSCTSTSSLTSRSVIRVWISALSSGAYSMVLREFLTNAMDDGTGSILPQPLRSLTRPLRATKYFLSVAVLGASVCDEMEPLSWDREGWALMKTILSCSYAPSSLSAPVLRWPSSALLTSSLTRSNGLAVQSSMIRTSTLSSNATRSFLLWLDSDSFVEGTAACSAPKTGRIFVHVACVKHTVKKCTVQSRITMYPLRCTLCSLRTAKIVVELCLARPCTGSWLALVAAAAATVSDTAVLVVKPFVAAAEPVELVAVRIAGHSIVPAGEQGVEHEAQPVAEHTLAPQFVLSSGHQTRPEVVVVDVPQSLAALRCFEGVRLSDKRFSCCVQSPDKQEKLDIAPIARR